jgi:chaperonin GroES
MKLIPLFDRVVIKPDIQTTTTKSGIVLPSTSQERPQMGKVVAIGSGLDIDANNVGMQVRVGDKVLFNKFAGSEVKIDNQTLIVIRQIDLIAIMEEINE